MSNNGGRGGRAGGGSNGRGRKAKDKAAANALAGVSTAMILPGSLSLH